MKPSFWQPPPNQLNRRGEQRRYSHHTIIKATTQFLGNKAAPKTLTAHCKRDVLVQPNPITVANSKQRIWYGIHIARLVRIPIQVADHT